MADDLRAEAREQVAEEVARLRNEPAVEPWTDEQITDAILALPAVQEALAAAEAVKRVRELADWFDGGGAGVPRRPARGNTSNAYAAQCIRRALAGEDR